MAAKAGNLCLLQVETTAGAGTYTTIPGLRTKEFTRNAELIDGTSHGSNQIREIVDVAGIKSITISAGGLVDSTETILNRIEDAFDSQTLTLFRFIEENGASGMRTYTMSCKITSFGRTAEYNGATEYTLALESSGAVTVS